MYKKISSFSLFLKKFYCKINNKFTFILHFFTVVSLTFLSMFVCITLKHLATRFRINKYKVISSFVEVLNSIANSLSRRRQKVRIETKRVFRLLSCSTYVFFETEVYSQSDNVKYWFS